MKKQSTKQLMQDLQAAISELKSVHNERTKIIENLTFGAHVEKTVAPANSDQTK